MSEITQFKGSVEDLTKLVEGHNGLTVVDLYATWCPSCKRLGMLLPNIANENPDVKFVKVDVDENPEVKQFFGVESIPVLKYLKKDSKLNAVDTIIGVNVPEIKNKIAANK